MALSTWVFNDDSSTPFMTAYDHPTQPSEKNGFLVTDSDIYELSSDLETARDIFGNKDYIVRNTIGGKEISISIDYAGISFYNQLRRIRARLRDRTRVSLTVTFNAEPMNDTIVLTNGVITSISNIEFRGIVSGGSFDMAIFFPQLPENYF